MNSIASNPDNQWSPRPHTIFKDTELAEQIQRDGYVVVPFLDESQVESLRKTFRKYHRIESGGMFLSHFSQDFEYRKNIHEELKAAMEPSFTRYFQNYTDALNTFFVKYPGEDSEFFIHQDPMFIDEFQHSPLHIWCPLLDIRMEHGPVCVMKHSHLLSFPYRGVAFPFPFEHIRDVVWRYLEPLYPKAGEAIFLDPRIIHNSLPNRSSEPRAAALSQMFPSEARFMSVYKEMDQPDAPVEVYEQPDDFFLKYENFYHNCETRPDTGELLRKTTYDFSYLTEEAFLDFCSKRHMAPLDLLPTRAEVSTRMIYEPVDSPSNDTKE